MNLEKWLLSLEEITDYGNQCFAHVSKKEKETLSEHTRRSQKYWCTIVKKKKIDKIFKEFEELYLKEICKTAKEIFETMLVNIVTMHDIGKLNPKFQAKKMGNRWKTETSPDNNIGSRHSILSSVFYVDFYYKKINKALNEDRTIKKEEADLLKDLVFVFAYIISKHHGRLKEWNQFVESMNNQETNGENLGYRAKQWLYKWNLEVAMTEEPAKMKKSWKKMMSRLKKEENEWQKMIYLYGFTRLLYSLLVAADYYATTEYMTGTNISDFGEFDLCADVISIYENMDVQKKIRKYEAEHYPMPCKELKNVDDINILRDEMYLDTENVLETNLDKNIFYLEAPTGSGKSNTAMNLSFKLLRNDVRLNKIFYIYPFNTLVEQNIRTMETIFGAHKDVMSQIAVVNSLIPMKDRDESEDWNKILLDRQFLNYPIVLSTHVMLFRTMFGAEKEDLFGFHQLCGSVIVLDEIQSYKNELWSSMILLLKAYAELFHIKIIIMSATLPNLEFFTGNKSDTVHLLNDRAKYFLHKKFVERVKADFGLLEQKIDLEELKNHVIQNIQSDKKILLEFIKKKTAEEFYHSIKEESAASVYLMTGDSSIEERRRLIQTINEADSLILVATQVIEAGVDIDMDIGYKDISKLDSEEQFMGRINRSGKKEGIVYFFDLDDAGQIYKNDVRAEKNKTLLNTEIQKMLIEKDFPAFYEREILSVLKKKDDQLDHQNLEDFFVDKVGELDFPAVAEKMRLIEDQRQCKSVYFGRIIIDEKGNSIDSNRLWEEYRILLTDNTMGYAERRGKLHNLRTEMNRFIYQLSKEVNIKEDEQIGDLYYIENGDKYFDKNGIINKELVEMGENLFI